MNKISKKFNKIFAFSLFFLSFPALAMAQCAGWDLGCWLSWLVTLIFRIPIFFFALIGMAIAAIALLIGWLIVPPIVNTLIKLSLNSAFYEGFSGTWKLVRGFSLSLVRIFLLIIGILTIFRVREYEARKTLVSLIIAALLLSFSFEIGKKIIEWGNVFTIYVANTFFKGEVGVGGNYLPNIGDIYAKLFDALMTHFGEIWKIFTLNGDLGKFFTTNLWIIILISFSYWVFAFLSIYISFVLLALGILFLIRLAYLVCLLIVSPIAFLTAGLRTREIRHIFGGFLNWDGWWPKFLEWVFIGIVLMIWLGVAVNIFKIAKKEVEGKTLKVPDCSIELSEQDPSVVSACNKEAQFIAERILSFLPPLAAAVALHIGVTTSPGMIKQAVQGIIGAVTLLATAVIAAATAAVTAGASAAASATAAGASRLGAAGAFLKAGITEGGRAFTGSLAKGIPELKAIPEEFKPGIEMVEEVKKRVPWVRRKIERPLIYGREEAEKEVERTLKEKGPKGIQEIAESKIASPVLRRAAIQKAMEERFDKGEEWVKDKEMRGMMLQNYEEVAKRGDKKTLGMIERRLVKSLAEDRELQESFKRIATKHKMYDEAKEGPFIERITKGVKSPDDVKQLQKGWWENIAIREMAEKFWTGAQWGAAAREFGKELVDALEPLINQLRTFRETNNVEGYLHFVWDRPGLARFSETAAAQEVGFPSWYEFAPEAVKSRYRNMREILAEKPPPRS